MITASAPGKIILFGEHAVVYQRPAIAVPVAQVQARVNLRETKTPFTIEARNQRRKVKFTDLRPEDPLKATLQLILNTFHLTVPSVLLTIDSTIPIASGLGSGAAVATALTRAFAKYVEQDLDSAAISALVYEIEKVHHGTPSGIDNTVIAFNQPVYFIRQQPIQTFHIAQSFQLAIGDTGIHSPTKIAVGDVRQNWEADKAHYEKIFDGCGNITQQARQHIENGLPDQLGALMNENHLLLREMGVSCEELDQLVEAATRAGALGAKLSGGGRGGNMIALVTPVTAPVVREALMKAGAKRVIITEVA